jgi:hypothetical protein
LQIIASRLLPGLVAVDRNLIGAVNRLDLTIMATLLRSPKSGSDWGLNELLAYSIDIQFQDAATFFGVNPLPQPSHNQPLLLKSSRGLWQTI